MLEKLAGTGCGLILLAGWALSGCSQEAEKPIEVGAVQVELRSDLVLPEAQTAPLGEEGPDFPGPPQKEFQATQRIPLKGPGQFRQDPEYRSINRYEFLPALLKDTRGRKKSGPEEGVWGNSMTVADKPWVLAGKGFGVGTEILNPSGTVHVNDAHYYFPTVALKPYAKASEHLEPIPGPFKSQKPLIFHSRATGFAHEPPANETPTGRSSPFETTLILSPIPETQVYFSSEPKTKVTLAPAKNRLDLMNGNENLNRHRFGKLPH